MAELYVEQVMDTVSKLCEKEGIGEGLFWHWLGNTKFKGDNGALTPERATYIRQHTSSLLKEYKELLNE